MKKRNGFTLVEILVAMSIVVMLAMMMIGIFNAIGITNKGRDAQRKKDLNRIKIAFEEYFNDKGEFPLDVSDWNKVENCKSNIFAPYLNSWPCDPKGKPYSILSEINKFRVITDLENKKDKDIPVGWYTRNDFQIIPLNLTTMNANYGVSSTNILWYEEYISNYDGCNINECLVKDIKGSCNECGNECDIKKDPSCYYRDNDSENNCDKHQAKCKVSCCGPGCD